MVVVERQRSSRVRVGLVFSLLLSSWRWWSRRPACRRQPTTRRRPGRRISRPSSTMQRIVFRMSFGRSASTMTITRTSAVTKACPAHLNPPSANVAQLSSMLEHHPASRAVISTFDPIPFLRLWASRHLLPALCPRPRLFLFL